MHGQQHIKKLAVTRNVTNTLFFKSIYRSGQALRVPSYQPYTLATFIPKEIFLVPVSVIG